MVKHILSISNKRNTNDLILIVFLLLFFTTAAQTQDTITDGDTQKVSPSSVLQEKVRQWVEIQKLRSKEKADWEEQKKSMEALNGIRSKEIEQIDVLIKAAGQRLTDATNKKNELLDEKDKLSIQRNVIEQRVIAIEKSLRNQLNLFPDPLVSKIKEELERIRDLNPESSLQDRLRDAVAILSAASDFAYSMTVSNELRDIEEKSVEVEVMYLGFSGAWYVSKNGKISGWGKASPNGWKWTEDKKVAQPLMEALEMYRKERAPDYVPFNFYGSDR
jgi:hypothetical protein